MLDQDPRVLELRNWTGSTGLHLAAEHNHVEVVNRIFDPEAKTRADVNILDGTSRTPLQSAARAGSVDAAKVLLSQPDVWIDTEDRSAPALHLAVMNSMSEVVQQLIYRGAKVNEPNTKNETALELAVRLADIKTVKTVLGAPDINVNVPGQSGMTPLHHAVRQKGPQSVEALLEVPDINLNAATDWGSIPLHHAAESGNLEITRLLLKRDATPENAEDDAISKEKSPNRKVKSYNLQATQRGFTGLHYSSRGTERPDYKEQDYVQIVDEFLRLPDIDISLKTKGENGMTAFEFAIVETGVRTVEVVKAHLNGKGKAKLQLEDLRKGLDVALDYKRDKVVEMLKARIASLEALDPSHVSAE
jgi:ankyrin repeat protein